MLDRITILGRVSEVDRETYWHFLEVLPPRWMGRGDFCFAEGAEPFWFFWEKGGRYFCRRLTWEQTRTFGDLAGIRRDYYYF